MPFPDKPLHSCCATDIKTCHLAHTSRVEGPRVHVRNWRGINIALSAVQAHVIHVYVGTNTQRLVMRGMRIATRPFKGEHKGHAIVMIVESLIKMHPTNPCASSSPMTGPVWTHSPALQTLRWQLSPCIPALFWRNDRRDRRNTFAHILFFRLTRRMEEETSYDY